MISSRGRTNVPTKRINLSPSQGFRRGEGGWVDGWWAFMVARGVGEKPMYCEIGVVRRSTAGDHKGPPVRSPPHSPLQMLMGFSQGVAYWGRLRSRWSDIRGFLLGGHQHMMPPRSITIPPNQTRGTRGFTKTRMVAWETPFQSARNT